MTKETAEIIKDTVDHSDSREVNLAQKYDVVVRKTGGETGVPQAPLRYEKKKFEGSSYCSSDVCREKRSSPPRYPPPQRSYYIEEKPKKLDTAEIHDLIEKLSKAVDHLDEKERVMAPFGSKPYRPLSQRERKSIDDLVSEGHFVLDSIEIIERSPHSNRDTTYMKEGDLKSVLLALKSKLTRQLSPEERKHYDEIEKLQLQQRMSSVEDRILGIMSDLEENDRHHAIAVARQRDQEKKEREKREYEEEKRRRAFEQERLRKAYEEEKMRKAYVEEKMRMANEEASQRRQCSYFRYYQEDYCATRGMQRT